MSRVDGNTWQLSLELPDDPPKTNNNRPVARGRNTGRGFSYFVIDKRWNTGSAPLGNTYLLPGDGAEIVRRPGNN